MQRADNAEDSNEFIEFMFRMIGDALMEISEANSKTNVATNDVEKRLLESRLKNKRFSIIEKLWEENTE